MFNVLWYAQIVLMYSSSLPCVFQGFAWWGEAIFWRFLQTVSAQRVWHKLLLIRFLFLEVHFGWVSTPLDSISPFNLSATMFTVLRYAQIVLMYSSSLPFLFQRFAWWGEAILRPGWHLLQTVAAQRVHKSFCSFVFSFKKGISVWFWASWISNPRSTCLCYHVHCPEICTNCSYVLI
jgi:hypothetical protein